ncbi:hypothetical protein CM49_02066 [Paenibacillus sp. P1XP2]|nr:hypothetical protein CM49_02066 [Paenibacillus sp. P1XP2]
MAADGAETVVEGAGKVLVLLRMFVSGSREAEWARLKAELAAEQRGYRELLAAHVREHRGLFDRVSLDLSAGGRERSNEELLLEAYQAKRRWPWWRKCGRTAGTCSFQAPAKGATPVIYTDYGAASTGAFGRSTWPMKTCR